MAKSRAGSIPVPRLTDAVWRRVSRRVRPASPADVVSARYLKGRDSIELSLRNGMSILFPRTQISELRSATPAELRRIEVQPGGDGISISSIDVDISVPGLLAEELGGVFARAIGRKARGCSSPKKAAASRRNGRRGGRPRIAA